MRQSCDYLPIPLGLLTDRMRYLLSWPVHTSRELSTQPSLEGAVSAFCNASATAITDMKA